MSIAPRDRVERPQLFWDLNRHIKSAASHIHEPLGLFLHVELLGFSAFDFLDVRILDRDVKHGGEVLAQSMGSG
jgi:hypothetical protein